MKENSTSRQTPTKAAGSTYSYEQKSLEESKLQNQVSLLKSKLRANRNGETRKKLEYRINAVEQDIAGFKSRQEKDRLSTKTSAEQFQQEIKQSLQACKDLEAKYRELREQQDRQKAQVGASINSNKEITQRLCALERQKKDKFEQTSKTDRQHRLQLEEVGRLEFAIQRLKAEESSLDERQAKLRDRLAKQTATNESWKQKVEKEQKSIDEGAEQMKEHFKQTNNHLIEEEKSMHKHLLVRDGLKEAEHKLREQSRKLQELTEVHDIELERNDIIKRRTEETVRLTETLEIPKSLEGKLEENRSRLEDLKQTLTKLVEENKQKQKLNEDVQPLLLQVLQQMRSLVQPDELFRQYLLRHQQIKQLQSRYKIESYAWIAGGQSRLFESRQKARSYAYNIEQPSPATLSSTFNRSTAKSILNLY